MSYLSPPSALHNQAKAKAAEDLTQSLRVAMRNHGYPLEDWRVAYVDTDFNIRWPDSRHESIMSREIGTSEGSYPEAVLHRFGNRIPDLLREYEERMLGGAK